MENITDSSVTYPSTRIGGRLACAAVLGIVGGTVWFYATYGGDLAALGQNGVTVYFGDVVNGQLQSWPQKIISVLLFTLPLIVPLGLTLIADIRGHQFTQHRRAYLMFMGWTMAAPLVISLIVWLTQGNTDLDGNRFWLGCAMLFFFLYFVSIPLFILPAFVSFCLIGTFGTPDNYGSLYGVTAWLAFVLAYTIALIHGFQLLDMTSYTLLMVVFMLMGLPFALILGKWGEQLREGTSS